MNDLLPALLIAVPFGLSFLANRYLGKPIRIALGAALAVFFLVMFFIEDTLRYNYLFFAFISLFFAFSIGKFSGRSRMVS